MFEKILQKLLSLFKSKNVEIKKEDLEAELKSEFSDLETKIKDLTVDNPVIKAMMDQNNVLIQQVKDLQAALIEEKKFREDAAKTAKEQADKDFEKKIADTIKKALDDKKITEAEKAEWEAKLKKDFEWANGDLNKLQVKKELKAPDKPAEKTEGNKDEYKNLIDNAKTLLSQSIQA